MTIFNKISGMIILCVILVLAVTSTPAAQKLWLTYDMARAFDLPVSRLSLECHHDNIALNQGELTLCLTPENGQSKRCEASFKLLEYAPSQHQIHYDFHLDEHMAAASNLYIISQVHALPDKQEPWRCPPLSFDVKNSTFFAHNRWDTNKITEDPHNKCIHSTSSIQGRKVLDGISLPEEQAWHEVNLDLTLSTENGSLALQLNEHQSDVLNGPNTYNDRRPPFLKLGIYNPHNAKIEKRQCITFKNIMISR